MDILDIMKALSNENRQKILFEILADKKKYNVKDIAKKMNLATSTTSEHLMVMKRAKIVSAVKLDKEVYYEVNKDTFLQLIKFIENWLSCC